jgi:hypothetical protein
MSTFRKVINMSLPADHTFFIDLMCREKSVATGRDFKYECLYHTGDYSCHDKDCLPFFVETENIRGLQAGTAFVATGTYQ